MCGGDKYFHSFLSIVVDSNRQGNNDYSDYPGISKNTLGTQQLVSVERKF